jgi:aquaporin SIP
MAMGAAVRAAAADAVVTFLWVLCASALGASTAAVTSYLGVPEGAGHYALLVTASLLAVLLFTFDLLCGALGGASFNPTDFAASYAAGLDSPSLFSVALRFPAQVRQRSTLFQSLSLPTKFRGIIKPNYEHLCYC